MGWAESKYRMFNVKMNVEVEEREEQLYEDDGKTPVTKQQTDGPAAGKRTRVKLKRYYYRVHVTISEAKLAVVEDGGTVAIGSDIAELKGQGNFNVSGDKGVKYLCGEEGGTLLNAVVGLWRYTRSWDGFGPWQKVPSGWGLEQTSETVAEGTQSTTPNGDNNSNNNSNNNSQGTT